MNKPIATADFVTQVTAVAGVARSMWPRRARPVRAGARSRYRKVPTPLRSTTRPVSTDPADLSTQLAPLT